MRRSAGHRSNIGTCRICRLSKITEGLRGNAATILAMLSTRIFRWSFAY